MKALNRDILNAAGLDGPAIARLLQITESAAYNKLAGRRPWSLPEIDELLAAAAKNLARAVTYEELLVDAQAPVAAAGGKRS